jgi:hypothetical protein
LRTSSTTLLTRRGLNGNDHLHENSAVRMAAKTTTEFQRILIAETPFYVPSKAFVPAKYAAICLLSNRKWKHSAPENLIPRWSSMLHYDTLHPD